MIHSFVICIRSQTVQSVCVYSITAVADVINIFFFSYLHALMIPPYIPPPILNHPSASHSHPAPAGELLMRFRPAGAPAAAGGAFV